MKIGFDLSSTQGNVTGLGYYTKELTSHLQKIAPEHEYLFLNSDQKDFSSFRRFWYDQFTVYRSLKGKKLDLFHKTAFSPPIFYQGKTVVTVADLIGMLFPENFGPIASLYWSKWLPYSIQKADFIITISEATQKDVIRLLKIPEEKIQTIYIACSKEFRLIQDKNKLQEIKIKYHLPDDYLLFVGTNEPRKNLAFLVKAFYDLKKEFPNLKLVIVGKKGWEKEPLSVKVDQLNLKKEILFPGYVDQEDLPGIYNLAKMLVFPSLYEGFGLPVLEALSCGLPVVCADNSSLPEVLGEAGFFIKANEIETYGKNITQVLKLNKSQLDKLREKSLYQAQKFSWEKCARETLKVYESLIQ